ncbi:MAG: peptidase T, partial [Bacillota bacterium]
MTREELLHEGVLAKLLRYVQVSTQSADGATVTPSTPGQLVLAEMLKEELLAMGLSDAGVDQYGFVTATLPANNGRGNGPAVGFLAHMDTVPGVPGDGVRPIVHRGYAGGCITLPSGAVLDPKDLVALQACIGHDIVTSDGNTLLGADNKAGIAEIMEAVCYLLRNPDRKHGPVKVAFTPDEEVGSGIDKFDVDSFAADAAYTLDGSVLGELEDECFNAANYQIIITGKSSHTGTARGNMINAVHLVSQLCADIPAGMRPETTDGKWGFIHPNGISGNFEQLKLSVLVRDFDAQGFAHKKQLLASLVKSLEDRYPGAKAELVETGGYRNMKEILNQKPQ